MKIQPRLPFQGFPRDLTHFLQELKANNNREWFEKNKPRYEQELLVPALSFIASIEKPLAKVTKHFVAVPKRTGGSLMRIYRDTRFSKDKTPYKTNVGIQFRHELGKDVHAPGFYFHIDADNVFIGAGVWRPAGPVISKIRTFIEDYPARWKRTRNSKGLTSQFEFAGESLKRPPRGYDSEHPLINDLKRKDHIIVSNLKVSDLYDKKIVDKTIARIKTAKPFVKMLCDALHIPI